MSAAIHTLNPNAEVLKRDQALSTIVNAALGLQSVIRTNLGPRGTMKMWH
jgi:T-complex protein 1 subunit zeta